LLYPWDVPVARNPSPALNFWQAVVLLLPVPARFVRLGGPLALACWLVAGFSTPAAAQEMARVAVVQASADADGHADLRGALGRSARTRVEALGIGTSAGTPGVTLADLGLAVGCVGETDACFAAIARQLDVDTMLVLALDFVGSSTTLTLTRFDATAGQTTRLQLEATDDAELVSQLDAGLRELFGLPAAEATPPPDGNRVNVVPPESHEAPPPTSNGGLRRVGFALGATGIATLAGGLVVGLMSQSTRDDYAHMPVTNAAEARRASNTYGKAHRQAITADALYGVGGALVAVGVVTLIFSRGHDTREEEVAFVPVAGRGYAGLQLQGRFGRSW